MEKFKLIDKTARESVYESDSFKLYKFSSNPSNALKSSGYRLRIKGCRLAGSQYFTSLKDAKEWANSEEARAWVENARRHA